MIAHMTADPITQAQVRNLVLRERQIALSEREWKHRLAGYGYAVKHTEHGHLVTTLPHGVVVCRLPNGEVTVAGA